MLTHPCTPGVNPLDRGVAPVQRAFKFSLLGFTSLFIQHTGLRFSVASVWLWGQGNAGLVKFIWKCPFSVFLEEFKMFTAAFYFIIAKTWKQQADEENR